MSGDTELLSRQLQRFATEEHPHCLLLLEEDLRFARLISPSFDLPGSGDLIPYPIEWVESRRSFRSFLKTWRGRYALRTTHAQDDTERAPSPPSLDVSLRSQEAFHPSLIPSRSSDHFLDVPSHSQAINLEAPLPPPPVVLRSPQPLRFSPLRSGNQLIEDDPPTDVSPTFLGRFQNSFRISHSHRRNLFGSNPEIASSARRLTDPPGNPSSPCQRRLSTPGPPGGFPSQESSPLVTPSSQSEGIPSLSQDFHRPSVELGRAASPILQSDISSLLHGTHSETQETIPLPPPDRRPASLQGMSNNAEDAGGLSADALARIVSQAVAATMAAVRQQPQGNGNGGDNADGGASSSRPSLKPDDVGYFNPGQKDPEGHGIVAAGKHTIYTNIFAFTHRLKHLETTRGAQAVREVWSLCLQGTALHWHTVELTSLERAALSEGDVDRINLALEHRFKKEKSEAMKSLNSLRFTLWDLHCGKKMRAFVQQVLSDAQSCDLPVPNQLLWAFEAFDSEIQGQLVKPDQKTTMASFLDKIDDQESILVNRAKERFGPPLDQSAAQPVSAYYGNQQNPYPRQNHTQYWRNTPSRQYHNSHYQDSRQRPWSTNRPPPQYHTPNRYSPPNQVPQRNAQVPQKDAQAQPQNRPQYDRPQNDRQWNNRSPFPGQQQPRPYQSNNRPPYQQTSWRPQRQNQHVYFNDQEEVIPQGVDDSGFRPEDFTDLDENNWTGPQEEREADPGLGPHMEEADGLFAVTDVAHFGSVQQAKTEIVCHNCGLSFPSNNRLHSHLRTDCKVRPSPSSASSATMQESSSAGSSTSGSTVPRKRRKPTRKASTSPLDDLPGSPVHYFDVFPAEPASSQHADHRMSVDTVLNPTQSQSKNCRPMKPRPRTPSVRGS